jgi:hypothetical protein
MAAEDLGPAGEKQTKWDHCDLCGWLMEANRQCTNEDCDNFPSADRGVTTHSVGANDNITPLIRMPNHQQRRMMAKQKRKSDAQERALRIKETEEKKRRKKQARKRTYAERRARKRGG